MKMSRAKNKEVNPNEAFKLKAVLVVITFKNIKKKIYNPMLNIINCAKGLFPSNLVISLGSMKTNHEKANNPAYIMYLISCLFILKVIVAP